MPYFLVCGSRGFIDRELIDFELNSRLERYGSHNFMVINGKCPDSADEIASDWCAFKEIPCLEWPARWRTGTHGSKEGPIRNDRMVGWLSQFRHMLKCEIIGFWDGKSRGTLGTLNLGEPYNILTTVVYPSGKSEVWFEPFPRNSEQSALPVD